MRRFVFFLIGCGIALALAPAAPADLRYVPEVVAVTYLVLALAAGAENAFDRRPDRDDRTRT